LALSALWLVSFFFVWLAAHHIFPPNGGNLRIDLGDQITDDDMLRQCEENYRQLLEKIEAKKRGEE